MSGQRYIPSRDRSPPRSVDRFVPSSTVHPDRAPIFAPSPTTRDPPNRDSRISSDSQRPSFGGSSYFRGRGGFSSRPDYRTEYRDRDSRDRRDASPYGSIDRDRSWRDRDSDRGRSPPRARDRDFRDFRDAPRGRGRRGSFDSDTFPPSRGRGSIASGGPTRGSFSRGRGRGGEWDFRGARGRGHSADDGHDLLRGPRSRSPVRERSSRWQEDDRSAGRRDDYRPLTRDDRPRDSDRFRDASPEPRGPAGGRRPSLPSINVSTASAAANPSSQALSARPYDARDPRDSSLRRSSTIHAPDPSRDGPRELLPPPSESPGQAQPNSTAGPASRPLSPPRPTDVPAFGSVPIKPAQQQEGWNIWRAPPTEPKAVRQASTTSTTSNDIAKPTDFPNVKPEPNAQPPTAPRAERMSLHGPSEPRGASNTALVQASTPSSSRPNGQTPTAPAADRDALPGAPSARSPPTGPRFLGSGHGPRPSNRPELPMASARSPTVPAAIPTGPRGAIAPTLNSHAIPTGPRAERSGPIAQPGSRQPPFGPAAMPTWQRSRPGPPTPVIPTKRDFLGDAKDNQSAHPSQDISKASSVAPAPGPRISVDAAKVKDEKTFPAKDGDMSDRQAAGQHGMNEHEDDDDDDLMDLDERDVEENEAKFQRSKAALEARKIDVNTEYFRAVDLTRKLALLHNFSLNDLSNIFGQKASEEVPIVDRLPGSETNVDPRNLEDMLTPKTEEKEVENPAIDHQDTLMQSPISPGAIDASPSTSPPPVGSPEVKSLPFLNQEPLTPLSELEIYNENLSRNELAKDQICTQLIERTRAKLDTYEENCREYRELYRVWRLDVQELERELTDFEKEEAVEEPAVAEAVPEVSPMLPTPTEQTGRRSRYTSEYSLEQALKKSQETAKAEQLQREREAAQSKRDPDREADIPEMMASDTIRSFAFEDTTYRRSSEKAVKFWQLQPREDDFTPEEHKTMIENFREYPKKWGKIASALEGRTYKDCINHYYATKWNKEFKPKVKSRSRKSAKSAGKLPGGKALRANHLLNDVGVDVYGADDAAAPLVSRTSGGRPKRAAAPTSFNEDQNAAKKGVRPSNVSETNPEKTARKGKGVPRGGGNQRKSGRTAARQRSMSPAKPDQPMEPRQPELETPSRFIAAASELSNPVGLTAMTPTLPQATLMRPAADTRFGHVQDLIGPAQGMPGMGETNRSPAANPSRGPPTSYWSVHDTNKFPEYLEEFGSDWQAISNQMGSKSATMVKNHFQRLVGSGRHDIQELATRADEGRSRSKKVPVEPADPVSSAASPTKHRMDALGAGLPRSSAPDRTQREVIDIDEDPPAVSRPMSGDPGLPRYGSYATSLPTSLPAAPAHPSVVSNPGLEPVTQRRESVDWRQGIPRIPQVERDFTQAFGDRFSGRPNDRPSAWEPYRSNAERGPPRHEDEVLIYRRAGQTALQQIPEPPTFPRGPAMDERVSQTPIADRPWAPRSKPDILQPTPADRMSHAPSAVSHFVRQSPPPQNRVSAFSPHQSSSFAGARGVDLTGRDVLRYTDSRVGLSSGQFGAEAHQSRSGPPTPFYERGQRTSWGSSADEGRLQSHPIQTEDRSRNTPSGPASGTPRSQTPVPPVSQPPKPKKSNLSALLNPEPEDPKPTRPQPPPPSSVTPRARTPPQSLFGSHVAPPPRPASQMEPRQNLFSDSRQASSSFQPGALNQLSHASPPLPSHEPGRSHSSMHDRPPAVLQPSSQPGPQHPFSRPMEPPSLQQRHNSLQNLRAPANASPPPQTYGYVQQALHNGGSLHARQSSFSRPPAGPFAERRDTYGERPYAPATPTSGERRGYGEHGFPPPHSTTPSHHQPFESHYTPSSSSSRYGPPGGNDGSHLHNTALLPGYSQAQRDPFGGRPFSGSFLDREREQRERRDREEQDRSRPMGGSQHPGYGFMPGRDR